MSDRIEFQLPRDMFITSNDRLHWREEARKTRDLRDIACLKARTGLTPVTGPVHVHAAIAYPRNYKADPDNFQPSVKALMDGIVDAGILTDDNSQHVVWTHYTRDPSKPPKGQYRVTLIITDQFVPF